MNYMPSAMKGVVLTSTGEILATATPTELVNLFKRSPKVGLNFGKIFDFEEGDSGEKEIQDRHEDDSASPPPSPSSRRERAKDKIRTRTTHRLGIQLLRRVRVRRTPESSQML